jgi:hypothetical protein
MRENELIYKKFQMMEEVNYKLKSEIPKIGQLLNEINIDYCVIGGACLPIYNLNRATKDVNLLIYAKDREKLESLIGIYFKLQFSDSKRNLIWKKGNILVDYFFSGEVSGSTGGLEFQKPSLLCIEIEGIKIITLPNLIQYKLSSGTYGRRSKDLSDVEELIKINNLPFNYSEVNRFREDLIRIWENCWSNADFDKQNKENNYL